MKYFRKFGFLEKCILIFGQGELLLFINNWKVSLFMSTKPFLMEKGREIAPAAINWQITYNYERIKVCAFFPENIIWFCTLPEKIRGIYHLYKRKYCRFFDKDTYDNLQQVPMSKNKVRIYQLLLCKWLISPCVKMIMQQWGMKLLLVLCWRERRQVTLDHDIRPWH